MGVNKMQVGQEVKFDLTGDTVTPQTLIRGVTAHNHAGDSITGEAYSVPSGGETGEALVKLSGTDGDAAWGIPKSAGITLTRAEYDALTDAEKNDGTLYFISDEAGGGSDGDVSYMEINDLLDHGFPSSVITVNGNTITEIEQIIDGEVTTNGRRIITTTTATNGIKTITAVLYSAQGAEIARAVTTVNGNTITTVQTRA